MFRNCGWAPEHREFAVGAASEANGGWVLPEEGQSERFTVKHSGLSEVANRHGCHHHRCTDHRPLPPRFDTRLPRVGFNLLTRCTSRFADSLPTGTLSA